MIDWVKITNTDFDYTIDYSPTKPVSLKPLDAALYTISEIQKKYPPPYTLFLSGGVDSQAMLYAWHISKAPYKTFSAIYNFNFNDHDLENLRLFSKTIDADINFEYFNLLNFLQDEFPTYAHTYRCASPQICTFMKMVSTIQEGTCIFSGNFIHLRERFVDKNNFGMYTYAKKENKNIVPWFFVETEELAYSFFRPNDDSKKDYENKCKLYIENGFPIIPQTTKYTGFEVIKDYYDMNFGYMLTKSDRMVRSLRQPSTRKFDSLYRNNYDMKFASDKYFLIHRDRLC